MKAYGPWLARVPAVLPALAAARQAPPDDSDRAAVPFETGMTALAGQTGDRAARRPFHDRAIDACRRPPRPSHGAQRNETPR